MQVSAKLRHCRGYSLGVPKLDVDLDVKNVSNQLLNVLHVIAEVRAAASLQTFDYRKSTYFVGHALLESGGGQLNPGHESSWTMSISLTPYQLQKIEEIRASGDLCLTMRFMCNAAEFDTADLTKLLRFCAVEVGAPGFSSNYCPFKIAQSDWMKILQELGYGDYFLIEVPLRRVRGGKQMAKALEHLSRAWEHYEHGNDRETLASCYSAFEFIAKQAKCKNPDQNAFEKLLGTVESSDTRDKLKFLMDYICRFLQLGRHVQGHELAHVEHKDSEFGLILSQAALAYLAKSTDHETPKS